jgi:hypothetical protein
MQPRNRQAAAAAALLERFSIAPSPQRLFPEPNSVQCMQTNKPVSSLGLIKKSTTSKLEKKHAKKTGAIILFYGLHL